jgi:hypothetical protein
LPFVLPTSAIAFPTNDFQFPTTQPNQNSTNKQTNKNVIILCDGVANGSGKSSEVDDAKKKSETVHVRAFVCALERGW